MSRPRITIGAVTAMLTVSAFMAAAVCGAAEGPPAPFDPGRTTFTVKVRSHLVPYRVLAVFVMPGEILELSIAEAAAQRAFRMTSVEGEILTDGPRQWRWPAPDRPGCYPLIMTETDTGETMVLNAFVLVPATSVVDGLLNGYRIGEYPRRPYKGLEIYQPPAGFVEVTRANVDTQVAPHFTLGQFLCKQESEYPEYLLLRTRLLLKLELLLEKVNEAGYRYDTFAIMSGYRTPYYNKAIGNVKYSRHVWGGAADIYLDAVPQDGNMDDLNGDGRIDYNDAAIVYDIVDALYGEPFYAPFAGGLGRYRRSASHGPFVHVDVRGFRARWGD